MRCALGDRRAADDKADLERAATAEKETDLDGGDSAGIPLVAARRGDSRIEGFRAGATTRASGANEVRTPGCSSSGIGSGLGYP